MQKTKAVLLSEEKLQNKEITIINEKPNEKIPCDPMVARINKVQKSAKTVIVIRKIFLVGLKNNMLVETKHRNKNKKIGFVSIVSIRVKRRAAPIIVPAITPINNLFKLKKLVGIFSNAALVSVSSSF